MTDEQRADIDALILAGSIIPAMARIKQACAISLADAGDFFRSRYRQLRAQRGADFARGDEEYWSSYGEDLFDAIAKDW